MDDITFLTVIGSLDTGTGIGSPPPPPQAISNDGTSGNYLSAANPTSLTFTDSDTVIFGCWINLANRVNNGFIGKLDAGTMDNAYYFGTDGSGKLDFVVLGLVDGEIIATSALSTSTKYFCLAWFDPATTTMNIQYNNGTVASTVYTPATISMGSGTFYLADDGTSSLVLNGVLDEVFVCKNPPSLAAALTELNSIVYNSGTGKRYKNLSTTTKTTIGLQNWWGLDEASGTRKDLYSSVDLTETGTLTVDTALVS